MRELYFICFNWNPDGARVKKSAVGKAYQILITKRADMK